MTVTCGLFIYSECFTGGIMAVQDGLFNGRPQYDFSFSFNGNIINGRIYWDSNENVWYAEDTGAQQIMSVLPFDRPHPYGTNAEWENYTLLTYGCLSNSTSFNTIWFPDCPPTYFEFCCLGENSTKIFIGVQDFEYYGYIGSIFYLESPQFSGCATVIQGPIPNNSIVYNSVSNSVQYDRCVSCTADTVSCITQPVYTTPTPRPVVTANTVCGGVSLVNECLPISVPIMTVICETTNVTTYGGNDGSVELIISGGTPPYNILWQNGNTGYGIYNLIVGRYEYTVTDYYGDYTTNGNCLVQQPPVPTPPAPPSNFCLTVNINGQVFNIQFEPVSPFNPSSPGYIGYDEEGEHIYDLGAFPGSGQPKWSIEGGILGGDLVNYNLSYPPLSGWTWLGSGIGTANGIEDDCQNYGDFCMTLNVNSFATQPYRIQFQQGGIVNGQPSWIDTSNIYSVIWVTGNNTNPPYWSLVGLPNYFNNPIVNNDPTVPPLNGWTVEGTSGDIETNEGDCFSEFICANFKSDCGDESIELSSGDTINNNPTWYGILPCGEEGSFFIFWNDEDNYWSTSGLTSVTGFGDEARKISNSYTGPFGVLSTEGNFELSVFEGECNQPGRALTITTTVNEPVTGSDGGIVIGVDGGVEPYEYSVDNGTSYRNLPIFYGLKSGIYVISVKDSNGVVTKTSVTLKVPQPKTVYQVSLNTTSRRTSNTTTVTTTEYTTAVSVVPSLPSGVTITFDLIHTDNYNVSPYDYSATLTLGSIILKNGSEILPDLTEYNSYSEINTTIGCQNYTKYITATTDTWQNITMGHGDNVIVTTTVSILRNGRYPCYSAINTENYSLFNLSIIGCSNCEVSNQQGLPPISPTPSTTPSTTPTNTNTNTALT